MRFLLLFFVFGFASAQFLNWAFLDQSHPHLRALGGMRLGQVADEDLDPDSNSTQSIINLITQTYLDEEDIWRGAFSGEQIGVPTYSYILQMAEIMSHIANYIRQQYTSIYGELDLETCNSLTSATEIILDNNLGLGNDRIIFNATDIQSLIPQHNCVVPDFLLYDPTDGPNFNNLRKFMPQYKTYLLKLNDYLECIIGFSSFPSYTKGVNCMEDYYFGWEDAGSNPSIFDLIQIKRDYANSADDFIASPMPADVTLIVSNTWTELQYELDIARQYKEIARKLRYTSVIVYTSLAKLYARLSRTKVCRDIQSVIYLAGKNTTRFWCDYQNCYTDSVSFSLLGVPFVVGDPLEPISNSFCDNTTCNLLETNPSPLYCDLTRDCPIGWYCSLIDRTCYKNEERGTFQRSYNKTICGYPRRLADASIIDGSIVAAFGASVNESSFTFQTFWPQNCTDTLALVEDISSARYTIGPVTFSQVCYPFLPLSDPNAFYVNSTTDCSLLDTSTICFPLTSYYKFVDGIAVELRNDTFCITRTSLGTETWQIQHCYTNGQAPLVFDDYGNYTGDLSSYMLCNSSGCITQNSTNVCYNQVQDVHRFYNHFLSSETVTCTDIRIWGSENNITDYNYTDPNAGSLPPSSQPIPTGFTNFGYFKVLDSQYVGVSGTYTLTGIGAAPSSLSGGEYAEFYGYFSVTTVGVQLLFTLKGRLYFQTSNTSYAEGSNYFLTTTSSPVINYYSVGGLAVDNSTGQVLYNPIIDSHPNPRFNDPDECFYLQVSSSANIPMTLSQAQREDFKALWMSDVFPYSRPDNNAGELYPCTPMFLRKVLYIDPFWYSTHSIINYELGLAEDSLRFECRINLDMKPSCLRFGIPLPTTRYANILDNVNPPTGEVDPL